MIFNERELNQAYERDLDAAIERQFGEPEPDSFEDTYRDHRAEEAEDRADDDRHGLLDG